MEDNYKLLDKLLSLTKDKENSNKEKIFLHFLKGMWDLSRIEMEEFYSCLKTSDNIQADVANVKQYFAWIPLDPEIKNKYKKNGEFSTAFRNLGNAAFKRKCFTEAVRSYNLSLLFADDSGQYPGANFAVIYANRSAALNGLGLTDEGLEDIILALSLCDPNDLIMQQKWNDRKKRFEEQINERLKNPSFEGKLNDEISKRNTFYEEMFTLKSPNPLAPALEDSVDIKWNSAHGRHLVANRDIPIGTTVLVEKPFASTLTNFQIWDVDSCHHCLKRNFRCIPCPNCVFTLYCNEKCLTEAKEYHQYQCPCLPELHFLVNDDEEKFFLIKLAFKLVCSLGPQKLLDIFKERKQNTYSIRKPSENNNFIVGSDPDTGIYSPNSYSSMFNMMATKAPGDDYSYSILLSLALSQVLMSSSNFFDLICFEERGEKLEFQDFIAEVILHHFNTFTMNAFGIGGIASMNGITLRTHMMKNSTESNKPVGLGMEDYDIESTAAGAYATASLINHSCDENVTRIFGKKFGIMAVIAMKSLKKGQELFISYGPLYGSDDQEEAINERQVALRDVYSFICDCIACKHDWPGGEKLNKRHPVFCCSACSNEFPHESKMSAEFDNCKLSKFDFKCKLCNCQYSERNILQEYERHCKSLNTCQKLIFSNYPLEALPSLKSAMQFFETTVCPPNYKCLTGSYLFNKAVLLIIFFS